MKPDINPGKVHPQLIGNGHLVHLVDGALVGSGSLQQIFPRPGQLEPASGSVSESTTMESNCCNNALEPTAIGLEYP